jgi:hypothetical protein
MAGLTSELFRGDPRLERCLVSDPHHVTPGTTGPFVAKIQYALLVLDGGSISGSEVQNAHYGPDTAALVLAYKTKRRIINFSYQSKPDNIVGKMTIKSLDAEMVAFEIKERMVQNRPRPR